MPVEVRNLSELGYVSTQEVIGLYRELQEGYRPDVVIFYDGVNDTTSAVLSGQAGVTTNEINRHDEFNLLPIAGQARRAPWPASFWLTRALFGSRRAVKSRLERPGPGSSSPLAG